MIRTRYLNNSAIAVNLENVIQFQYVHIIY